MPDEKIVRKRPAQAESEPERAQQRAVDETVDDSFPASDPPSWTTTGSKSVAARRGPDDATDDALMPLDQGLYSGTGETARHLADKASTLAREFYHRGEAYIQEGWRHLPETQRYYRQGTQVMSRSLHEHPLTAVVIAGTVGFALGWFLGRSAAKPVTRPKWRPVYNQRPIREREWHSESYAPVRRQTSRFATRSEVEVASHTNNSF